MNSSLLGQGDHATGNELHTCSVARSDPASCVSRLLPLKGGGTTYDLLFLVLVREKVLDRVD